MNILKSLLQTGFCLSIVFPMASQAQSQLNSIEKINEVEVFRSGAQIHSSIQTQLKTGLNTIYVYRISNSIDPNSVHVNAFGNIAIQSISVKNNPIPVENQAEFIVYADSLQDMNNEMMEEKNRLFVLEQEESLVLANKSIGGANSGVIVVDLEEAANFFRKRLSDIKQRQLEVKQNIYELEKGLDLLRQRVNKVKANLMETNRIIEISVSSTASSIIGFELEYFIYNAGWNPYYEITSSSSDKPIQLKLKAEVFQNSGKDWNDTKLSLNSGDPVVNGVKPEVNPYFIDFVQSSINSLNIKGARGNSTPYYVDGIKMNKEADNVDEVSGSYAITAQVGTNELTTNYSFDINYSILTGSQPIAVELENQTITPQYSYSCVPKMSNKAFLIAGITEWQKYGLISANANVFFEGSFVGTTFIDAQSTSDTLLVSLGNDKKVNITRQKVKDLSAEKVIGSSKKSTLVYEISIKNNKATPLKIKIEDQIPVSKNTAIEVKLLDQGQAQYNAETGVLTWLKSVNSGEVVKLRFSYEVKYPKDKVISGL
jgi:uncharacterized protein (TIGR02231 family)